MSDLVAVKFTKDDLIKSLPRKFSRSITDEILDEVNNALSSSIAEPFEDNFISMVDVLSNGRYKLSHYVNAVKFVSHRLMDVSLVEAYSRVFPKKYKELVASGTSRDVISSFASAYNKNKLVVSLFTRSIIPVHVLNAEIHQKAINKLAAIMANDEASFKNQIEAATGLLVHLKAPEEAKLTIDVTSKGSEALDDLKSITRALAAQQRQILETGKVSAKEIAHSNIIKTIPSTK